MNTFHQRLHTLWVLPFICFIFGYYVMAHFYVEEEITPPSVIGKNIQDAIGMLSQANLSARLLAYKEDAHVPSGTILNQMPTQSHKMRPQQPVYVTVSIKPTQQKAPIVINKSIENITKQLAAVGIKPKIYFLSSSYPNNTCFAQFPSPSQSVDQGLVVLYISRGAQKPTIMPLLKGEKVFSALDFLANYPLKVVIKHTTVQPDDHICHDCTITDQQPLAGSIVSLQQEMPLIVQLIVA